MEEEIKIALVPRKQTGEKTDLIRITCGAITAWGVTLQEAFDDFEEQRKSVTCATKTVTA